MELRISGTINDSIVDGPGLRYTIFTQGCYHNCKGCHNPQTHDPEKGKSVDIDTLFEEIKANPILDGVTFSGGEPFLQAGVLATLGRKIKEELNLNIITYTGFTFEEIQKELENPLNLDWLRLMCVSDFLIDSKFEQENKSLDCKFRGSTNQRFLDCKESRKQKKPIEVEEYKYVKTEGNEKENIENESGES